MAGWRSCCWGPGNLSQSGGASGGTAAAREVIEELAKSAGKVETGCLDEDSSGTSDSCCGSSASGRGRLGKHLYY